MYKLMIFLWSLHHWDKFVGWADEKAEACGRIIHDCTCHEETTAYAWYGITWYLFLVMEFSSDFMPYVGEVSNKPGQFILAGFPGHGMPLICLASKGIAAMLRSEKTFEQTGVPKLFKPSANKLNSTKNDILDSLATPLPTSKLWELDNCKCFN